MCPKNNPKETLNTLGQRTKGIAGEDENDGETLARYMHLHDHHGAMNTGQQRQQKSSTVANDMR